MARWYVAGPNGEPHGPYDADSLRGYAAEGRIDGSTRVCVEGATTWVPASSVDDLGIAPLPAGNDAAAFIVPIGVPVSAVISCWMGIVSMIVCFPLGPVALILGIVGLRTIKRSQPEADPTTSRPLGIARAWIGIITGSIGTLIAVAFVVLIAIGEMT
ncbi:MAG: DUF4339 domain-containing protein [Planctomycetes bacterium]|nr:DUF4339 domain-containing protein [Planctomycetota bacterium]